MSHSETPAAEGPQPNLYEIDLTRDPVARDARPEPALVQVKAGGMVPQVRLTFTSAEVGNGNPLDSNTLANQDGRLAVRVQAEDAGGALTGPVHRFEDEGVIFVSDGTFTFDVRDLVSGAARGDRFDVVQLGTQASEALSARQMDKAYYINAGMGDDSVYGGFAEDFLVGGAGNDLLKGLIGDDSFIGGGGDDMLFGGRGDDLAIFNAGTDGSDRVDLGAGADQVNVAAAAGTTQIRLTFTSAEVGNGQANDSGMLANQDGGLAVRLQAEDGMDGLVGLVSRFDDEGISFVSTVPGLTFDVRDLVSGAARGNQFSVVTLGTSGNDRFDETGETLAYYINAGGGDDRITGGSGNDFLVGNVGNDRLNGGLGSDTMIGGTGSDVFVFRNEVGNDSIVDFVSGTDKIDLTAFRRVDLGDISVSMSGLATVLGVDANNNGVADFTITLANGAMPVAADYLFA